jgi:pseudouridine-5'-phosphate glycosidase
MHYSCIINKSFLTNPCTLVKDGVCRVGLTPEELDDLAISGVEKRATKCSTKDLPLVIAKQRAFLERNENKSAPSQWGATTVASTMHLAHMAGISVFVTGGTGGVHRGGENTMDISADLIELARTPVVVVSAGVKSILDISRTLETLETNGVPAAAFGVDEFPAFFSPSSGVTAPARVDSAEEVASAYLTSLGLGLKNGMLIAVPNSDPAGESVEMAIQEVLDEASELGISGRDVTPYILQKLAEKTKGDSLKSNMSLVKGNAAVGADIAVAIENARRNVNKGQKAIDTSVSIGGSSMQALKKEKKLFRDSGTRKPSSRVVVMGGSVIDLVANPAAGTSLILGTSNPGSCHESDGGVARNIAEVLGRLGSRPILFSAVGDDSRGLSLMERMANEYGFDIDRQHIEVVRGSNTATYLAVLEEDGDLHTAIADMDVLAKIKIPDEEVS